MASNTIFWARRLGADGLLPAARARLESAPGYSYFVGSAVFHYLGPAFAVLLFARVGPLGVA